jgi:FtsZ-binding cell division protein ZapB
VEDATGLDFETFKKLPEIVKQLNNTVTYSRIESEQMKEQAALRASGFSEAQIQKADAEARDAFQRGEVRSYRAAYRMALFDQKPAGAPSAQRIAKADAEKAGRAFKLGNAAKGNAGGVNRGTATNEADLSKEALAAAARGDIRLALRELGRNQKP